MKQKHFFALSLAAFTTIFHGCVGDGIDTIVLPERDRGSAEGSIPSSVIPNSIRTGLESTMPIYNGTTPPNINGQYRANNLNLNSSSDGGGGTGTITYLYLDFSNGTNGECTLSYRETRNGVQYGSDNVKARVVGEGNNFTVYFTTSEGQSYVISGTLTGGGSGGGGISNLYYAIVTPNDKSCGCASYRSFKDSDGYTEEYNWISNVSSSSSSSSVSSSSSIAPSSSSPTTTCGGNPYNPSTQYCSNGVVREYGSVNGYIPGDIYKTIVIGEQTWMAENLRGDRIGKCYGDNTENCTKYGRLYDWATAMAGVKMVYACPVGNPNYICPFQQKCPNGWHIPSNEDFGKLRNYVENQKSCSQCAGKYLKAKTDWNSGGNGEDAFGFAALPSGYYDDGTYYQIGQYARWWTEDERDAENSYLWRIDYNADSLANFYDKKTFHYGIRCIKNSEYPEYGSCNIADYESVPIGTQVWMAKNYGCYVPGSRCRDDNLANCEIYGRLYDWTTAMSVCPNGWHLPSDAEWTELIDLAGGETVAGAKLKAASGWDDFRGESGNGTDEYGFAALPGDYDGGTAGSWWTATERPPDDAYYWIMRNSHEEVFKGYNNKRGFSYVRCLRDN